MSRLRLLSVLIVAPLLAGCCIETKQPLFTARDAVRDPLFEGTWMAAEEHYIVADLGKDGYKLTMQPASGPEEKPREFTAPIFHRLGDHYFVGLPDDNRIMILRVWFSGPALRAAMLNEPKLREYLAANPKAMDYEIRTAPGQFSTSLLVLKG